MKLETKSRNFGIELQAYNYLHGYDSEQARVRCIAGVLWFKCKGRIVHRYPAIGFVGYRPFIEF